MRWPWQKKKEHEHLRAGRWGEKQAEHLLEGKGYKILGRRVHVGLRDELDLVARHGDVLVFVEVKTRAGEMFGRPIESVNKAKRHVLSRGAIRYMTKLREKPDHFRFDVVEVIGKPCSDPEIRHIENAFNLDPMYKIPW